MHPILSVYHEFQNSFSHLFLQLPVVLLIAFLYRFFQSYLSKQSIHFLFHGAVFLDQSMQTAQQLSFLPCLPGSLLHIPFLAALKNDSMHQFLSASDPFSFEIVVAV